MNESKTAKHGANKVPKGKVRVFITPGRDLYPQPVNEWSTTGHAWSVLDIPVGLYEETTKAIKEYERTQCLLRKYLNKTKRFCCCGSNHADLEPDFDY